MDTKLRIVSLRAPLLYLVSHLSLDVNYSGHTPLNENMNFNLMELLPRLKSGICDERTIYSIMAAYINLNYKTNLTQNKIFREAFVGHIMVSDTTPYNTYQYLSMTYFDFDPKNCTMADVIKCNIYDTNYDDKIANDLIDEYILAYGIKDATIALKSSVSNFYGVPDILTLGYLIEDLLVNYNDEAASQLYNNNKLKLYVAIISGGRKFIKEYLYNIDPRDDDNNALYLARYILSKSEDDTMTEIVKILMNNILMRNWCEKQVLIINIDPLVGSSDVPDTLHLYIRQLLK